MLDVLLCDEPAENCPDRVSEVEQRHRQRATLHRRAFDDERGQACDDGPATANVVCQGRERNGSVSHSDETGAEDGSRLFRG